MKYRADSINPIDEVEKVNVPILLIHGDVEQKPPGRFPGRGCQSIQRASNAMRANAAVRLASRPFFGFLARDVVAKQTPEALR